MSTEIDEFRQTLVAAVQAELERHASAVVSQVDRLREEGQRERAEMRSEFTQQISQLAQAIEEVQVRNENHATKVRESLEQRVEEAEARQVRRLDETTAGFDGLLQEAARPLLAEVRDRQETLAHRVDTLDGNLRKFDEQAARMVTYFNDVSQQMEANARTSSARRCAPTSRPGSRRSPSWSTTTTPPFGASRPRSARRSRRS